MPRDEGPHLLKRALQSHSGWEMIDVVGMPRDEGGIILFFNRKKEPDPIEEVSTDIWRCVVDSCTGWARKEYFFSQEPICPFCESDMVSDTKMLPVLFDRLPT